MQLIQNKGKNITGAEHLELKKCFQKILHNKTMCIEKQKLENTYCTRFFFICFKK